MSDGWRRACVCLSAAVAAVCFAAAQTTTAYAGSPPSCTPAAAWGIPRQELVRDVLARLNADREKRALPLLRPSPSLTRAALWKSLHMAGHAYLAHADPAPIARSVGQRLAACGYPSRLSGWGENIAAGYRSPSAVVAGWLDSPGHRRNIETRAFTTVGIGVAASPTGRLYWTTDFGTA